MYCTEQTEIPSGGRRTGEVFKGVEREAREMNHGRTRKEMKRDSESHYEGMAEQTTDPKAKERFRRPAYQARGMIREQGRQMERMSAEKYLTNKLNTRG